MIQYILFDLDNTLYPESCGIQDEIMRRMTREVSRHLGVDGEEALRLRDEGFRKYGTTLRWLQIEKNLSEQQVADFLEAVHPDNPGDFLVPDPRLNGVLESIPVPMAVLTNSPIKHAKRMLNHLGISQRFTHVFDITFNKLQGKPNPQAYTRVLDTLEMAAEQVLFIDDVPAYLDGFKVLGGKTLLIDEFDTIGETDHPKIQRISQLPSFLQDYQL